MEEMMGKFDAWKNLKRIEKKLHRPGVTIGRPIGDKPEHLANFHVHLLFQELGSKGYPVDPYDLWHPAGSSIVAQARNVIVDTFLARDGKNGPKHEYLLFIDDDQCFPDGYDPYEAFKMLIDADKDIIGAMTVRKFPPYKPNISMFYEGDTRVIGTWPEDEPFRGQQLGFGMVLIKRKVIETMRNIANPPVPIFQNPIQFNPMTKMNVLRGEDYWFCLNAMKCGFDIWVEPRVPLMHIGWYAFGVDNFKAWREETLKHERLLDICQNTDLYAPLAEALKKSGAQYLSTPENLSDAALAAVKQKGTIAASESSNTGPTSPDATTPKQKSNTKNEKEKETSGSK